MIQMGLIILHGNLFGSSGISILIMRDSSYKIWSQVRTYDIKIISLSIVDAST